MRHFSKLFCFLLAFVLAGSTYAQLSPGDIAFVSFDSDDPDAFSFLALTTIPSGTVIKFTDNGWIATSNSFRANEGIWNVTLTTEITCGTEIQVTAAGPADLMGNSVGSITTSGSLALSSSGDQILAYQGDEAAPSFIAAVNFEGSSWQADATSAATSALPAGLTDGMTAVAVAEVDNAQYSCITESGTKGDLLMAINNAGNWLGSDATKQAPAGCLFNPSDCSSGPGGPGGGDCAEVFISEYIEGSSLNKCIELYNPTSAAISLANYSLSVSFNGGSSTSNISLTGSIPAFGTYVICNPSSGAAFLAKADQTSGSINHNGDDAYTLLKDGNIIDRFGQLGVDPGSQWSGGGVTTQNQTLVRKQSVAKGDPNATDPFDPSVEWDGYGIDESSFLGFHNSVCGPAEPSCLITNISLTDVLGCNNGGSLTQDDDFFAANITIEYQGAPASGNLVITGDILFPFSGELVIPVADLTGSPFTIDGTYSGYARAMATVADGMPVSLTATFSDEPSCTFTNPVAGIALRPCSLPECTPVINELDYNNPGTDDREFVEIYNPCSQPINLADYSVIFVNGSNGQIYGDFALPAVMLAPGDFFVICGNGSTTPNCDYDVSPNSNLIQNGDPDAVALLYGEAIADAVSYGGSTNGFTEGSGDGLSDSPAALRGIGRYVDGVDTDRNNVDFSAQCITPGEPNTNVNQYCGLPGDFMVSNIGCFGFNDAGYDDFNGTFTLTTICGHAYGGQDQVLFVGKQACGYTSSVSARITGVVPSTGYAGISMRESDDPGARKMSIIRYPDGRKIVEYRPWANGYYYQYWLPAYTIYADYVRISRWGDYFFAEVSYDGNYWMTIYQQYMGGMPDCVKAGMVASSYYYGLTTNASFSNFNITGSGTAPRPVDPTTINSDEPISFEVFPNPVVDELSVSIGNAPAEEATITILSLDGREMYRGIHNIDGSTVNLQLSGLQMTAGMYILTVNTGKEILTKRFVKANP